MILRSFVVALVVVVGPLATAHADTPRHTTKVKPKTPPKISAAARKTYTTQLREGRKLADKKQYAAAIAAFEAALVAMPDDPTAQGELGFAAYLAKDLVKGEAMTRKAIANAVTPSVRGSSLYNLGLILEARKDMPGAIAAYTQSLVERPNVTVRARLAKLSPNALAAIDPFAPSTMSGPFASLDAFCKTQPKTAEDFDGFKCACAGTEIATKALAAPYTGVALVEVSCSPEMTERTHGWRFAAVRTSAGWFTQHVGEFDGNTHCDSAGEITDPHTDQLVPGDPQELSLTFAASGSCVGRSELSTSFATSSLIVVGIGVSTHKPTSTPLIELESSEWTEGDTAYDEHANAPAVYSREVALVPTWKDGTLTLAGPTKGLDKDEAARRLAPHKLAFP